MRILAFLAIAAVAACGVDGPPERPAAQSHSGVTVSGYATVGTVTDL
ncbi:hypothetical protein [Paracoccus onubensis]|nr:hypothetical protein [Paracoccus onubensis]